MSVPNQSKLIQTRVNTFLVTWKKNSEQFVPIDISRQPKEILGKRFGLKVSSIQSIQKVEDKKDEIGEEGKEKEDEDAKDQKKRGIYDRIDYATKKNVIEEHILYCQDTPLEDGKPQCFCDFCYQVAANIGKSDQLWNIYVSVIKETFNLNSVTNALFQWKNFKMLPITQRDPRLLTIRNKTSGW